MKSAASYILPFVFCVTSLTCSKEVITKNENEIKIPAGTSSIMLEFSSSADGKTIPVYVALPSSLTPPVKAVVVLHGSGGPWDDDDTNGDGIADICHVGELSRQNEEWKNLLLLQGFAVAFPDSYSPRGTCENEGGYKNPPLKFKISGTFVRNHDAFGTLELLGSLVSETTGKPIIDLENVAVLGFSDGGTAVISTMYDESSTPAQWVWKQSFDGVTYTSEILAPPALQPSVKFKTAVAYYPGAYHNSYYGNTCNTTGIYRSYSDILFHLAEDDPLSEKSECLIETMHRLGGGVPAVYRYENADHGFDSNDEPENSIARERTIDFIKDKLQH